MLTLPSHPDFLPIEKAIREKYSLPELSPDDDPITEIYLGDEIVPLEEFRKDIERRIRGNLSFLPHGLLNIYLSAKEFSKTQYKTQLIEGYALLSDDMKKAMDEIAKLLEVITNLLFQIVDPMISSIVDMLHIFLVTGESEEMPNDCISPQLSEPRS